MTQIELAHKLCVSFQSISQWERDKRNPKRETLKRIAKALGCPAWKLTGGGMRLLNKVKPFVSDKQGHLDIWIDSHDLEMLELRAEEEGKTLEDYLAEYLSVDNDNYMYEHNDEPAECYE